MISKQRHFLLHIDIYGFTDKKGFFKNYLEMLILLENDFFKMIFNNGLYPESGYVQRYGQEMMFSK